MSNTKQFLEKILKESDEVPYCDDVNCKPVNERQDPEEGFEIDEELAKQCDGIHYNGVFTTYIEDTNTLLFTREKPEGQDYKDEDDLGTIVYRNETPEEIKEFIDKMVAPNGKDSFIKEAEEEEVQTEEQPQEEPVNDFERLSPEVQEILNDMSNDNAMYKWVIDDVMDSDISGYNGDTFDEKLKSRLEEITEHGCQSGTVSSLIYYTDTVKFFDNFNDEIYDMVEDVFGAESTLEMLQRHCELIDIVMGADTVKNYLAWMAYEVTCSNILDSIESA